MFQADAKLETIFIDTNYDKTDETELEKFKLYTTALWNFADNVEPFPCRDLKKLESYWEKEKQKNEDMNKKYDNMLQGMTQAREELEKLKIERDKEQEKNRQVYRMTRFDRKAIDF